MNSSVRPQQYIVLIEKFGSRTLSANAFCRNFTALWIQDRNNTDAKKAAWPQPYDEILLAKWQRGEISESEFRQEFARLWGYADEIEFRNMINEIHSACSVFNPSPELSWELDEEQLRQAVQKTYAEYERTMQPVAARL